MNNSFKRSSTDVLKLSFKISLLVGLTIGLIEASILGIEIILDNTLSLSLFTNLVKLATFSSVLFCLFMLVISLLSTAFLHFLIDKQAGAAKSKFEAWALRLNWFVGCFFIFVIWLNFNTLRPIFSLESILLHAAILLLAIGIAEVATRLTSQTLSEIPLWKNRRPRPVALVWGAALLAAIFYGSFSKVETQTQKPNVILLIVDTLRADRLGSYGYAKNTSPNIDEIAEQSTLFDQAYVQWASSLPSHASIMTSLQPHLHGAFPNGNSLNPELLTLAKVLKAYGYTNGAFVTNRLVGNQYHFDLGFDRFFDLAEIDYKNATLSAWLHSLNLVRVLDKIRQIDIFTDLAIAWLEHNRDKPVFLWLQWLHPHDPYDPPAEFVSKLAPTNGKATSASFDENDISTLYDGEVAYNDFLIGKVIRQLRNLDMLENSLLVITSDHGENLNDHDVGSGHAGVYDTSIRIPLIFYFPEKTPERKRVGHIVQSIDITPTILDLLEIEAPKQFQGKTLQPLMHHDSANWESQAYSIMLQKRRNWFALRSDDWKIILNAHGKDQNEYELYHMHSDPGELTNRFETDPAIADSLKQMLTSWIASNFEPIEMAYTPGLKLKDEFDKATEQRLRSLGYIK